MYMKKVRPNFSCPAEISEQIRAAIEAGASESKDEGPR